MNKYALTIMDRAYQSFVTGGDTYTFNYPQGKKAFEKQPFIEAIEALEADGMLVVTLRNEKRIRLKLTDKGIDFGNRQTL